MSKTKQEQLRAKYARTAGRVKGREARLDRTEIEELLDMTAAPDPDARCEAEVVAALEAMYQDPDHKLRRHVRHVLAHYRAHGVINVG